MKKETWRQIFFMLLFPFAVFYFELCFALTMFGRVSPASILFFLLFSVFFGGIGYLLSSLFASRTANKVIAACLLGLSAFPFLFHAFAYKQFNVFYDLATVTGGAGDAVSSFTKEILELIVNPEGAVLFLIFLLPMILYLIFSKKFLPAVRATAISRIISMVSAVVALGLALLIIFFQPLFYAKYKTEFDLQNATEQFGLLPASCLDAKYFLFPEEEEFTPVDTGTPSTAAPQTAAPATEAPETEPPVTDHEDQVLPETEPAETDPPEIPSGPNMLEIDFSGLNEGASKSIVALNNYVASLTPTEKNAYTGLFAGKNLIFITAEAFSPFLIDEELMPTIYRLANNGIRFTDYYQQSGSGTTGGEYQNVFGMLPMTGGRAFKNTQSTYNYFTIGSQLNRLGYYGKAYHNNSYTYYDRHLTHNNLGYSDGFMGYGNGMEAYVKNQWPQSDFEMIKGTLPEYIDKAPFNIYYMSVSGHGNYTRTGNSMTKRHWDRVQQLPYSDTVKGYFAANLDLEDGLAYLVSELEQRGIADDTVIVIAADHFPYCLPSDSLLGEDYLAELYGYTVKTCFDRDISSLIIWSGCLEEREPIVVSEPTSSLDILPTLSNLFGTAFDSRFMVGRDVFAGTEALVFYKDYSFKTTLGTYLAQTGRFVPVDDETEIPEGYVDRIKAIIKNKLKYCTDVPKTDYFRHVFE